MNLNDFIGRELDYCLSVIQSQKKMVEVIEYNDRKMTAFDTKLVLRATEEENKVTLMVGNFFLEKNC